MNAPCPARGLAAAIMALAACSGHAAPPVAAAGAGFECLVEPRQVVELRSPVEGLIEAVHADRGERVRRGQVLVTLASEVERSTVEAARHRADMDGRIQQARSRVEFAQRKVERARHLVQENYLSAQARDEAETELRLAQADLLDAQETRQQAKLELQRAQDLLAQRTLRSPFDGYVVERLLNPGDLAEAGTGRRPVLKLAQLDPLRIEVSLPQPAWGRVAVGQRASVHLEGSAQAHEALVKVVDRTIDAASGLFGVRLELPNPGSALPAGQRCRVALAGVEPPAAAAALRRPGTAAGH